MSYLDENALYSLFQRLKQTEIEDFDQEAYAGKETDTERLEWLKDLAAALQKAVDDKESEIRDLESEVDDLRAVASALGTVADRVKLRLGINTVEGQLPLPPTEAVATETGG